VVLAATGALAGAQNAVAEASIELGDLDSADAANSLTAFGGGLMYLRRRGHAFPVALSLSFLLGLWIYWKGDWKFW
jgi:hypothetical protein